MRVIAIPVIAATVLFSAPLLAQTGSQQQGTGSPQQSTGATQQPQTGSQQTSGDMMASQQQVRESLQQAGFKNIQILDTSYLVQAETALAERVLMVVSPTAGTASIIERSGSTGATGGPATGSGQSGDQQQQQQQSQPQPQSPSQSQQPASQ